MPRTVKKSRIKQKKRTGSEVYSSGLTKDNLRDLLYYMKLHRESEERILKLYRQGKIIGGVYTGSGMEAIAVGSAYALEDDDILVPLHRDMGAHIVRGNTLKRIFCQYLGRANGPTKGRDGNMHMGDPDLNIYGMVSHLGTMIPVALGAALAGRMRGKKTVALNYIGDGGASIGDFHEALNMASVLKVGLVLVLENNQYAYSTPNSYQYNAENLADRAIGYNIPGVIVDGNDVLDVYEAVRKAVVDAREGKGPTLIEAKTMRMHGHSAHDDHKYVPEEKLEEWRKKDPIIRFAKYLSNNEFFTEKELADMHEQVLREIDEAVEFAENSPFPEGNEALLGVYAD
ncbi:MAG: thiamine pyrophosphate-dependent dehydrogenase E1 component subunit alpha [bacterium]|nr:thiamine pyrophosphate-dependent dehydrogenase E1 component subunit alpha [bacterium]